MTEQLTQILGVRKRWRWKRAAAAVEYMKEREAPEQKPMEVHSKIMGYSEFLEKDLTRESGLPVYNYKP